MDRQIMLAMYEHEIKTMENDLKSVKSRLSEQAILRELKEIREQYEFSKRM